MALFGNADGVGTGAVGVGTGAVGVGVRTGVTVGCAAGWTS